MAICPGGGYYITDNRNFGVASIRFVDANGIISTPVLDGSADPEYVRNGGIECPWGCFMSPSGTTLYVVDECGRVVYGIDTTSFIVTRVAGQGFTGGSGALGFHMRDPYEVSCDSRGNLAIADVGQSSIIGVNMNSTNQVMCGVTIVPGDAQFIAGNGIYRVDYGMAFDPSDNLYVTYQGNNSGLGNIVWKVDALTGANTVFAGIAGNDFNAGDGGAPTSASFDSPFQLSLDSNGILYVIANGLNGGSAAVIRGINTSGISQTVCGVSILPNTIETVYSGFSINANPWYTLPDNLGNVYVCDVGPRNHGCRVFLLTSAGGYSVVAGDATGVCGFSGDGGPATSALIGEAFAIALAPSSNPSLCGCGPQPVGNPLID